MVYAAIRTGKGRGPRARPEDMWFTFSASKLIDCMACPLRGFLAYGLRLPTPYNAFAAHGTALHGMFEQFFTRARVNKRYPYEDQGAFVNAWRYQWYGAVNGEFPFGKRGLNKQLKAAGWKPTTVQWSSTAQPHSLYHDGVKILTLFHERFAPIRYDGTLRVVEKQFRFTWHGFTFTGRVDRIDYQPDGAVLIDYKPWGFYEYQRLSDVQMTMYQLAYERSIRAKAPRHLPLDALRVYHYKQGAVQDVPLRAEMDFGILFAAIVETGQYYQAVLTGRGTGMGIPRTFQLYRDDDVERGDITPRLPRGRHCTYCPFLEQCVAWKQGRLPRSRDAFNAHWHGKLEQRRPTQQRLDLACSFDVRVGAGSMNALIGRMVAQQGVLDGIALCDVPEVPKRPKYRSRKRL